MILIIVEIVSPRGRLNYNKHTKQSTDIVKIFDLSTLFFGPPLKIFWFKQDSILFIYSFSTFPNSSHKEFTLVPISAGRALRLS